MIYLILKEFAECCGCHSPFDIIYISQDLDKTQAILNDLKGKEKLFHPNFRFNYSQYYIQEYNLDTLI